MVQGIISNTLESPIMDNGHKELDTTEQLNNDNGK